MIRKLAAASLVLLGMQVLSVAAGAQNYPTQPVKIIVPYAPGAGNDMGSRWLIAGSPPAASGAPRRCVGRVAAAPCTR